MRILFRYVFMEFLVPLLYCLSGFIGIYVLFELFGSFSRMTAADISFGTAALYFAGYLSPFFHYLAPAALMLATIYTIWNLCRHCELTAMKASGVGPQAVIAPLMLGAVIVAGFTAWVNEYYMPRHALWAKQFRTARFRSEDAMRDCAPSYKDTKRNHSWVVAGEHNAACTHFTDVRITIANKDGSRERVLSAAAADWLDGEWWLTDAKTMHYAKRPAADSEAGVLEPVASSTPELDAVGLRVFPELREKPQDIQMQSAGAQFISARSKLRYLRRGADLSDGMRRDLMYDAWAQLVSPLACIVITLLSIPAGMTSGRDSVFAGILGALGMFFAYYAMVVGSMVLAKTGLVPPVPAALLPPIAFLALGLYRLARPLRPTLFLTVLYFLLYAIYVLAAFGLVRRLGMEPTMAHVVAATLPIAAAILAAFKLKPARRGGAA